jgi:hypothetical protein
VVVAQVEEQVVVLVVTELLQAQVVEALLLKTL